MPAYWLLKTEPDAYSYADLEREVETIWDGVRNNAALKHLRAMQPGDLALIYHTGNERRAIGIAEVTSAAYPDPQADDPKMAVVNIRASRRLDQPITLATIKADPFFSDFALVRQGRLSVVPVNPEQWEKLMTLAR
jgi:predicted RNA-binding protein with PUA-like domain